MSRPPRSLWSAPASTNKNKRKPGSGKSLYAYRATDGQIVFPRHEQTGYLTTARMIKLAQSGESDAIQEIWSNNARLCYTVANKIRVRRDLVADLIQESQEAFPKAIRNFDIDRLLEFSTYAHAAIRSHMIRALSRIRFSTRIPSQLYGPLIRYLMHLENAPDRSHWFDERERMIDDELYERVRDLHAIANPYSLLEAKHTPCPQPSPQEAATHRDEAELLYRVSLNLCDRDRFILIHRYGLWGRPEMTLQQIGELLGITRERVRQLQLIAEQQLRKLLTESTPSTPQPSNCPPYHDARTD